MRSQSLFALLFLNHVLSFDDSNIFGGALRDQIKDVMDYYFNTDRLTKEPLPKEDHNFVDKSELYYHLVPHESVTLLQGARNLEFKIDEENIGQVTRLLDRIKKARSYMTSDTDIQILDRLQRDTERLQRLVLTLPNKIDTDDINTFTCTFRLDRFFYGLDEIVFKDETTRQKRQSRTRQNNKNDFMKNYLVLENKYEHCLQDSILDFRQIDSISSTKRTGCTAQNWIKLTKDTVDLMTNSPPQTDDEDLIGHHLVRKIIYSLPNIHDIEMILRDDLLSTYDHVRKPITLITSMDLAILETQMVLTTLPFLDNIEAMYYVRARRRQVSNRIDLLKVILYLENLDKIQTFFPTVDWEDILYKCNILDHLTEDQKHEFMQKNVQIAQDIKNYDTLCCTNRADYTCPQTQTYETYMAETDKVKGTILYSWIPYLRETQKNVPISEAWPELLNRGKEEKAKLIENDLHFTSTPFKRTGQDNTGITQNMSDLVIDNTISLSSSSNMTVDGLDKELGLLAGNIDLTEKSLVPITDNPLPDILSSDAQPSGQKTTPLNLEYEKDKSNNNNRIVRDNTDKASADNDDDNAASASASKKLEFESISSDCYENFHKGNDYDQTCAKLFHYDHTVAQTKLKKKNNEQDYQLYNNIVLDTLSQVVYYAINLQNVKYNPSMEALNAMCEDTSHIKHVLKNANNDKLTVYLYETESTIYLPTAFCSELFCHTLITTRTYIRSRRNEHCHSAQRVNDKTYYCLTKLSHKVPNCYATLGPTKDCKFTQVKNSRVSSVYHLINDNTALLIPSDNVLKVNNDMAEKRIANILVKSQIKEGCTKKLEESQFFLSDLDIIRLFDVPDNLRTQFGKLYWLASNVTVMGWIALGIGIFLMLILITCTYAKCYRYCKYKKVRTDDIELTERQNCENEHGNHPVLILKKKKKRSNRAS